MPDPLRTITPPGAVPPPVALGEKIARAIDDRPPGETPRTRHRDGDVPEFTNRLILETSPYLRQHAHNPVNWYPWGDEAFADARRTGRPIFLSVGYSTCHWCHVMEEESFEDLEIARFLNENYVAIKVDREERPDVDAVYMTAVHVISRHGGWPMSVWLDSKRRPFFAGTYFPARDGDRGAHAGFLTVLKQLLDIYRSDPDRVAGAAQSIAESVHAMMTGSDAADALPGVDLLDAAAHYHLAAYDETYGGERGAPKFPATFPTRLMLRHYRRTGDAAALAAAKHTLEAMAAGGMYDQLGGGFHRYSTDERWLVPHFEKMLYDNALLAVAYSEAWQITKRPDFERVVRSTLDYLLREMTSPWGGFYSATDADSEGEEGTFFVWSEAELQSLLGAQAERFNRYYGVTARGNFEEQNVLYVPHPNEDEHAALAGARDIALAAREQRPRPLRDEKILVAWNGLAISAMATGGRALGDGRYIDAAIGAATFVLENACPGGRLQRSWKDDRTSGPGFLEDDAFFVAGLLDLYEATFDRRWLENALTLAVGTERFADADRGGWYRTASDHEVLPARERPAYDGAEPAGASVALMNALRLHAFTGNDRWREIAERALRAFAPAMTYPAALSEMLLALDFYLDRPREIVLVWPREEGPPEQLLDSLRRMFLPNRAILGAAEGVELEALSELAPIASGKTPLHGRAAAYVCRDGTCSLPTTEAAAMNEELAAR